MAEIIELEDFAKLRQINRQLVRTKFLPGWNFRLDIPGAPNDFDFYIKDITYSEIDVKTDEASYGAAVYVHPTGEGPVRCSFTMRDNEDGRNQTFFTKWLHFVFPRDGTVNTPFGKPGYVKDITLYEVSISGKKKPQWRRKMYPTNMGEVSRSRENGSFFEIPVTLTEFSTIM